MYVFKQQLFLLLLFIKKFREEWPSFLSCDMDRVENETIGWGGTQANNEITQT
jgi:hypothetical protein